MRDKIRIYLDKISLTHSTFNVPPLILTNGDVTNCVENFKGSNYIGDPASLHCFKTGDCMYIFIGVLK